jgi:hypothetical protein
MKNPGAWFVKSATGAISSGWCDSGVFDRDALVCDLEGFDYDFVCV